jgi:heme-degrading monooxygenase HmoA
MSQVGVLVLYIGIVTQMTIVYSSTSRKVLVTTEWRSLSAFKNFFKLDFTQLSDITIEQSNRV